MKKQKTTQLKQKKSDRMRDLETVSLNKQIIRDQEQNMRREFCTKTFISLQDYCHILKMLKMLLTD